MALGEHDIVGVASRELATMCDGFLNVATLVLRYGVWGLRFGVWRLTFEARGVWGLGRCFLGFGV